MIGCRLTNRGRYQCNFCTHPSYKIYGAMINHLNTKHKMEFKLAQKDAEIERLKNKPPKVEIKEKVVYKEEPKKEFWNHGIYCSNCKVVYSNAGIPYGQTIENTPHSTCGLKTLMSVEEVIW